MGCIQTHVRFGDLATMQPAENHAHCMRLPVASEGRKVVFGFFVGFR